MSHSVSSKARADREGGFSFECHDWHGNLFRAQGGFSTQPEAIRAAEQAEREMTMKMQIPAGATTLDEILSDDELLAELLA